MTQWVKRDVPACDGSCGKTGDAHVHLPTYNRLSVNEDGTITILVPPDYFAKNGAIEVEKLKTWYEGTWADVHGERIPRESSDPSSVD